MSNTFQGTCARFMLAEEEEEEGSENSDLSDVEEVTVSIQALEGGKLTRTMRVTEEVEGKELSILVDSGSTHNFIKQRVAKRLSQSISLDTSFQVLVADDNKLQCSGVRWNIPVRIHGFKFYTDLYVMPIKGLEMVLGIQWLQQFRKTTND